MGLKSEKQIAHKFCHVPTRGRGSVHHQRILLPQLTRLFIGSAPNSVSANFSGSAKLTTLLEAGYQESREMENEKMK